MKIGLDFDGVIGDCGRLKSETALDVYGIVIPSDKFKKEFITDYDISSEQYLNVLRLIYTTREYGFRLTPVQDVFKFLSILTKQHEVQIVTSRSGESVVVAQEWLFKHNPGLKVEFNGVGYGNSKANALKGFDVFVDDDLNKLMDLVEVVPHRFLFSWGYNRHKVEGEVAKRVNSWVELNNRLLEIDNKAG